jgi:hypothetical protein
LHGWVSELNIKVDIRLIWFVFSNSVNGNFYNLQNQKKTNLEGVIAERVLTWPNNLLRAGLAALSSSRK